MATSSEPPKEPTVHVAELDSGASGAVIWGDALTREQAVARRREGNDIVVRGETLANNRRVAREVESAVGPAELHQPHQRAGASALPHFQQESGEPGGHSFYETPNRKARKLK